MKKLILSFCLSFIGVYTFAQENNAIFFSEGGEKFFVVINGIQQNADAATNVRVSGLNAPNYKVKIVFVNGLPDLEKNIYFNEMDSEVTYNIKKNKKSEYVLRFQSQVPIAQASPAPPSQSVIVYHVDPPVATTTLTQTTTTTTTNGVPSQGASVGMNLGGTGINMNVSINDGSMNGNSSTTTTYSETTTTQISTSSVSPQQPVQETVVYVPGYNGPVGCPMPMSQGDFQSAKQTISSKSFEDSKLTIAKQIVNSNCLTSQQVRELLDQFDFEDSKLDFAKYCYGYTYDLGNYYKVNDAFTFESSIDDLNNYINAHK